MTCINLTQLCDIFPCWWAQKGECTTSEVIDNYQQDLQTRRLTLRRVFAAHSSSVSAASSLPCRR